MFSEHKLNTLFTFFGFILFFSIHSYSQSLAPNQTNSCHKVFDDLKMIKGLSTNQKPHLKVVDTLPDDQYRLAMLSNKEGVIYLESKTARLCLNEMGKDSLNALSFILAHELSHYLRKHKFKHEYIKKLQNQTNLSAISLNSIMTNNEVMVTESGMDKLNSLFKSQSKTFSVRKNESEADLDGGFLSYLAGYNVKDAGPSFLKMAYDSFPVMKDDPNYATLEERQFIVKQTSLKVDTLVEVFELANFLNLINEVEGADKTYAFVLDSYESKEILNNLGLMELHHLFMSVNERDIEFSFPLNLDMHFERELPDEFTTGVESFVEKSFREYLELEKHILKAIDYFERAQIMDHSYHISDLNLSIAYTVWQILEQRLAGHLGFRKLVQEKLVYAEAEAIKALRKLDMNSDSSPKAKADVCVQLSIIYHLTEDHDKKIRFLEKAKRIDQGNVHALFNENIFNDGFGFHSREIERSFFCPEILNIVNKHTEFFPEDKSQLEKGMEVILERRDHRFLDTMVVLNLERHTESSYYHLKEMFGNKLLKELKLVNIKSNQITDLVCGTLSKEMKFSDLTNASNNFKPLKIVETENGRFLYYKPNSMFDNMNGASEEIKHGFLIYTDNGGDIQNFIFYNSIF